MKTRRDEALTSELDNLKERTRKVLESSAEGGLYRSCSGRKMKEKRTPKRYVTNVKVSNNAVGVFLLSDQYTSGRANASDVLF